MAAIAVDRFTSLSQPLRYNDLITHTSMQRYLIGFWVYSVAVGFCPIFYIQTLSRSINRECFFPSLVSRPRSRHSTPPPRPVSSKTRISDRQIGAALPLLHHLRPLLRHPSSLLRLHIHPCPIPREGHLHCGDLHPAGRIRTHNRIQIRSDLSNHRRMLYLPLDAVPGTRTRNLSNVNKPPPTKSTLFAQSCMLIDIFNGTKLLGNWMSIYLSLPIFASSAINPWIYGYRNSEIRASVQRVIDDIFGKLGIPMQGIASASNRPPPGHAHPIIQSQVAPKAAGTTENRQNSTVWYRTCDCALPLRTG